MQIRYLKHLKVAQAIKLSLAVCIFLISATLYAKQPLTIGILEYLPKEQILQRYQPLADYLSDALEDRDVRLLPLSYNDNQIENAINNNQLDLLLTNPSHFIQLRTTHNLSGAMLTQVVLRNGEPVSDFGGVVIAHANNQNINTLADLADKRIAAVDPRSLGGYQAQEYEAMKQGFEPNGPLVFLKKHDKVVNAVLEGKADVGFIRSGVLEGMINADRLDINQLKILNSKSVKHFPFMLSTDLYPEWPLLALPRLPDKEIRRVASALLALDSKHPAASAAKIGGFNPPADYLPVETLARALRVPPYDQLPQFTFSDIWMKYQFALIIIVASLFVIAYLASLLWRRNIQLSSSAVKLRRSASVFSNTCEGISITDIHGTILDVNSAFEQMTGYTRAEVIGQNPITLKSALQSDQLYDEVSSSLQQTSGWQGQVLNKHKNGQLYAVQLAIGAIPSGNGDAEGYVGLFTDITQKYYLSALESLKSKAMQSTFEDTPLNEILDQLLKDIESLNLESKCSILLLDESGKHLMGCSAPSLPSAYNQAIDGIEIGDGIGSCGTAAFRKERVIVEDIQQHPYWAAFKGLAAEHKLGSCWSEPIFGKKGRLLGTFAIYHTEACTPIDRDLILISQISSFVGLLIEAQRIEEDLKCMATTDELTSLPNRRKLLATLNKELVRAKRYNKPLSFCMLDFDHFKKINDRYGHNAGDCALKGVASVMESMLRENDIVGRLGGEEFGILLPDTQAEDAMNLAEQFRAAIENHVIHHQKQRLKLTVSIGVTSLKPNSDISQASELLSAADHCLYHAKHNGRNRVSSIPTGLSTRP